MHQRCVGFSHVSTLVITYSPVLAGLNQWDSAFSWYCNKAFPLWWRRRVGGFDCVAFFSFNWRHYITFPTWHDSDELRYRAMDPFINRKGALHAFAFISAYCVLVVSCGNVLLLTWFYTYQDCVWVHVPVWVCTRLEVAADMDMKVLLCSSCGPQKGFRRQRLLRVSGWICSEEYGVYGFSAGLGYNFLVCSCRFELDHPRLDIWLFSGVGEAKYIEIASESKYSAYTKFSSRLII